MPTMPYLSDARFIPDLTVDDEEMQYILSQDSGVGVEYRGISSEDNTKQQYFSSTSQGEKAEYRSTPVRR